MDRLTSMEVFHWVVELGSFSRAAERLDLSKASVTAHIAALESRLGVKLLNRTTRRLSLTDDGASYLEHVRRILADVQETDAMLGAGRSVPRGLLRVEMPVTLGRQYIVPALPRFAAQYPELQVIALLEDRRTNLVEEGIDAAVRNGPLSDSTLIARRVFEAQWGTYASPDYLALHGEPQTPAELDGHNCLGLYVVSRGEAFDWAFEKDGERVVRPPGGRLIVSNGEAMLDAAVNGAGIVQSLDMFASRWVASGALRPILADWRRTDAYPISVVYPQGHHLSAKVRAFVDFVAGLFPKRRGR
jgi:LysR family transcriptional regulator, regulator for bpeEF and oprC